MFIESLEKFLNQIETVSKVEINKNIISLPLRYRCRTINLAFPISNFEAKKIIQNKNLRPLNILPGISLLCVTLFDFETSDIGPFTEMTTSIPVSRDGELNITPVSLLYKLIAKKIGFYVVNIAQSSQDAIDHGNRITGYPHYNKLISLSMKQDQALVKVNVTCEDELVLDLVIKRSLDSRLSLEQYNTYLVENNGVQEIIMQTYGLLEKSSIVRFELGKHELANFFKKLKLKKISLDTRYYNEMIKVIKVKKI